MADNAYFAGNPVKLDISRSRMTVKPRWTGHWNTGQLVPIFARQVLPGETMKMDISSAIRMVTPVVPVMDDMDITIEAFYVPNRLLLSRQTMSPSTSDSNHSWEAFIGAQDSLLNMPTPGEVKLPVCYVAEDNWAVGSLGDCLGFAKPQTSGGSYLVNCLKPLAYYSIWNNYFRDPNVQNPVTFSIGSVESDGYSRVSFYGTDANIPDDSYRTRPCYFPLADVSRYHGYFGSALPWPQRNSAQVTLPLGASAPVKTSASNVISSGADLPALRLWDRDSTGKAVVFSNGDDPVGLGVSTTHDVDLGAVIGVQPHESYVEGDTPGQYGVIPANLFTDLSQATAASVNSFRLAVQTQRWYEALARSGNKYPDLLAGMFDVRNNMGLSRPEYLGGFTAPIQMSQVAATAYIAGSTGNAGLGQVGAYSLSNPGGFLFSKSFTEHGIVMVVACVRTKESFAQGIQREDQRFERFDFYWPQFASLGEENLPTSRIYVSGSAGTDNLVFGYQEAWADERMIVDQVTGQFRPGGSMAHWTYVNNFATAPTLKGYLDASGQVSNVDRTLSSASSTTGFQFFGQFEFDVTMVKPMPLYSIPGLVDHH